MIGATRPGPQWYIGWVGDYSERSIECRLGNGGRRDHCVARFRDHTMGVRFVRRIP